MEAKEVGKMDIISIVAEKTGARKSDVAKIITSFCDTVMECVAKGKEVRIRGFGTFLQKERSARVGRNPKTGEEIKIPAKLVPVFRAGSDFKKLAEKEIKDKKKKK